MSFRARVLLHVALRDFNSSYKVHMGRNSFNLLKRVAQESMCYKKQARPFFVLLVRLIGGVLNHVQWKGGCFRAFPGQETFEKMDCHLEIH
jgi:hypothetical protein